MKKGLPLKKGPPLKRAPPPPAPPRPDQPHQSSGRFACRIAPCTAVLPICRLYNHVRQLHADVLTVSDLDLLGIGKQKTTPLPSVAKSDADVTAAADTATAPADAVKAPPAESAATIADDPATAAAESPATIAGDPKPAPRPKPIEYVERINVSLHRQLRRVVHIRRAGLFFICMDVPDRTDAAAADAAADAANQPTHHVWVQAACRNRDARFFKFSCQLLYDSGSKTADFEDFAFGGQSTAEHIKGQPNCLAVRVPPAVRAGTLYVHIRANEGTHDGRRKTKTTVHEKAAKGGGTKVKKAQKKPAAPKK